MDRDDVAARAAGAGARRSTIRRSRRSRRSCRSRRFRRFASPDGRVIGLAGRSSASREVVLFVDTFTNHFEPDNARAAQRVLEAAGYVVHVATSRGERPPCCGRTFLAAGLVDEARAEATRTLALFKPAIERRLPVVGLEPSCLFTLRDEFLAQHLGDDARNPRIARPHVRRVRRARIRSGTTSSFRCRPRRAKALLHGHCHQKAFDAVTPIVEVLKLIPELEVELIESSCCGMAGSFGYEAEHVDVSMKMGELALLPAVRNATADTVIIADGTSCRQQIHDGAGRARCTSRGCSSRRWRHVLLVLRQSACHT